MHDLHLDGIRIALLFGATTAVEVLWQSQELHLPYSSTWHAGTFTCGGALRAWCYQDLAHATRTMVLA